MTERPSDRDAVTELSTSGSPHSGATENLPPVCSARVSGQSRTTSMRCYAAAMAWPIMRGSSLPESPRVASVGSSPTDGCIAWPEAAT